MTAPLFTLLITVTLIIALVLFFVFVLVPVFRGIGAGVIALFSAIGWLVSHIFEYIAGTLSDVVRFIGSIPALLVLSALLMGSVIVGRWSAAGHYAESVKREFLAATGCLYRALLRRPLKLFWLHGLLEGVEQRVPEAMQAAPTSDTPDKRTGQFDGYTIVGSLPGGGSGGKLYVARPDEQKRRTLAGRPEHVVIKSFTLTEGSSLPQIVRESRALECAKQLGHVLEHGMDEHRFHYVMPYHPGDHLGIIARQLHAVSDGSGLERRQLTEVLGYIKDLLATLSVYHRGGFWHKDVKPENVIVHDGRAHLVDLGLITPLKSAMTLTTHGTEYFRDPEMVRQALRGVKVHQVNGAKFDLYAVGAVLYFMIENTFPAHGGLSRFTHNSPEALRWIVRRAMAEYNQRYESAEMMLADLEHVARASDPFAVKPAELPSMKAGAAEALEVDIETDSPQVAASAAGPEKRYTAPAGAFRTSAATGPAIDEPETVGPPPSSGPQRRPRLRVINWLTGEYVVEDPGSASAADAAWSAGDRAAHAGTAAHNRPWENRVREARATAKDARRRAREQVRAARERIKEVQRRATAKRHQVGIERQPSFLVSALILLVIGAIVAAIYFSVGTRSSVNPAVTNASNEHALSMLGWTAIPVVAPNLEPDWSAPSVRRTLQSYIDGGALLLFEEEPEDMQHMALLLADWQAERNEAVGQELRRMLRSRDSDAYLYLTAQSPDRGLRGSVVSTRFDAWQFPKLTEEGEPWSPESSPATLRPFLLINDHPARHSSSVKAFVEQALQQLDQNGRHVEIDTELEAQARRLMPSSGMPDGYHLPERLEKLLCEHDLDGIYYVHAPAGEGSVRDRVAMRAYRTRGLAPCKE